VLLFFARLMIFPPMVTYRVIERKEQKRVQFVEKRLIRYDWKTIEKIFIWDTVDFLIRITPTDGRRKLLMVRLSWRKFKKNIPNGVWKKKSVFWELPYWPYLDVRHCLDVMHIIKNICESFVGTLLKADRVGYDMSFFFWGDNKILKVRLSFFVLHLGFWTNVKGLVMCFVHLLFMLRIFFFVKGIWLYF
jgi:hypothetical protein